MVAAERYATEAIERADAAAVDPPPVVLLAMLAVAREWRDVDAYRRWLELPMQSP